MIEYNKNILGELFVKKFFSLLLVAVLLLGILSGCGKTGGEQKNEGPAPIDDGIIDAAVFVILGQSNAVGHATPLAQEDLITEPMKNVFGLHRKNNQSFNIKELVWAGYTNEGTNLGEEQDYVYSLSNCLANYWQDHIDAGNEKNLPDLYIINISIGAEGVTGNYMWNPNRPEKLIPGKLGEVNISLYPFTQHIFSLVDESFRAKKLDYEFVGVHWRGGENDISSILADPFIDLEGIYTTMLEGFNESLGNPPIVLHKIVCKDRMQGPKLKIMEDGNVMFDKFAEKYDNITTFDTRNYPEYDPNVLCENLFQADMIHYTAEVNKWVAQEIFNNYINK